MWSSLWPTRYREAEVGSLVTSSNRSGSSLSASSVLSPQRLLLLGLFDMSDHSDPVAGLPREQVDDKEAEPDNAGPDRLLAGGLNPGPPPEYGGTQARQSHAASSRPGESGPPLGEVAH